MPLEDVFNTYFDRAVQTAFKSLLMIFCPKISECIQSLKSVNEKSFELNKPLILNQVLLDYNYFMWTRTIEILRAVLKFCQ